MPTADHAVTTKRFIATILLAWLSMLGVDLLLHGGLLARFYVADDPFLLPPMEAFRLIPLGYASFLINAILLVWLMMRLGLGTIREGARFGTILGALVWGSWVLALASITTGGYPMLAGWFVGQTLEMTLAGGVAGAAFVHQRLRRVVLFVVALMLACIVLVVVLQNTGFAPAVRVGADR